ncbi:MAG: transposase, partial [Dehalococcoidia bacterium]|nr:transposase [Dehalococcoidia bacterium]
MKSRMKKYTIKDFDKNFPSDDACLEWIKNHVYPNGIYCPLCQMITKHHRMTTRRSYSC